VKVAYVVPRYGAEVIGGAEHGARVLGEHLVSELGWEVEVFTTCARDLGTWRDELDPGTTVEGGVTVHRFRSRSGRAADFDQRSAPLLSRPRGVSPDQADQWLRWQGPVCPDAVEAALASGAERLLPYPYLYHPTVEVVRRAGRRTVLHPATHDEAPLYLPCFDEVFARTGGLFLQTLSEQALVHRRFPATAGLPQQVVGLGVEEPPAIDVASARAAAGVGDRPFLVCLGRVDRGKGSHLLARYFTAYKQRRPGPLALVVAGPVREPLDDHPDVVVTGPVDEATKWGLLAGAEALVSPSPNESFSLVVLEAWQAGTPVVVNGACGPTVEHCRLSGGGLWFDGYATFEVILDRLAAGSGLGPALAAAGAGYVRDRFRWPVLIRRYAELLRRAGGTSRSPERSGG
jgi:glycosyltransferase involved in cell wall biosynthesis